MPATETMRRVVMVFIAALILVPVAMKSRTKQDIPAHAAFCALSSGRMYVSISGDVFHAGVYDVPANSLASTVIKLAEPMHPQHRYIIDPSAGHVLAAGSAVSLARKPDGSLLLSVDRMAVPERMMLGIPLEISVMNQADFNRLPGIGPVLARRIVEYRQNNGGNMRVDDLTAVAGIGEKKFKVLRTFFQPP